MQPRYTSITDKRNIKGLLKTLVQKKNLVQSMHEALEYKKFTFPHTENPEIKAHIEDYLKKQQEEYDRYINEIENTEEFIFSLMKTLTPVEHQIILNRYMMCYSLNKTARLMYYSPESIKLYTSSAIEKMKKEAEKNEKC